MKERESGPKRPNIVFLIADDHRFDAVGAYGNPTVRTPELDRLAAEGALFRSIYIMGGQTAAVCVPTRAALLTGTNTFRATASRPVSLGETENEETWSLNPRLPTFPQRLREEGYRTFGIGKWHNGKESFARSFGGGAEIFFGGMGDHTGLPVHRYDPAGIFPDDTARLSGAFSSELFADAAVDFVRSYDAEDPFLLYVAFTAPHDPRTPPPDFARMYDPEDIPLPGNFMSEHPFDNGEMDVRDEQLADTPRRPEEIRRHLADYYGMISHLDGQIGRIRQALADKGLDGDTIVVYTADHGLALGRHGLMGKQNLYEHSIHIPLIVSGPGIPQGTRIGGLGCQMDIYPTLCELAGTPVPDTVEGRSLVPLLTGERTAVRDDVFAVYKDVQRTVSDGHWKLIRYYRAGGAGSDRTQLFDLLEDPWEMNDLADDPAERTNRNRLEETMLRWQQDVHDPIWTESGK